jgi:small subunit ribosomal protein S20
LSGNISAQKRHRQSEKRRIRNKIIKTKVRNLTKVFMDSVSKSKKDEAESNFKSLSSLLDRAYQKGVYKRNNTARKKSRLHRLLKNIG